MILKLKLIMCVIYYIYINGNKVNDRVYITKFRTHNEIIIVVINNKILEKNNDIIIVSTLVINNKVLPSNFALLIYVKKQMKDRITSVNLMDKEIGVPQG